MEYTIKLNDKQMQVLQMALGELPMKIAFPLFQSINDQVLKAENQATAESDLSANVSP